MVTKKKISAAMKRAAARARTAGRKAVQRMAVSADAALVDAGEAAKRRQRGRALKTALKATGKAVVIAAATAATVLAARAATRARRQRAAAPTTTP